MPNYEEKTQIKFRDPTDNGVTFPMTIKLEGGESNPIEGVKEKENGEKFTWHKWLCENNSYFMASDNLDMMLKLLPNRFDAPIKVEKVPNSTSPYPYFQVNDMGLNQLQSQYGEFTNKEVSGVNKAPNYKIIADSLESILESIHSKLDDIKSILHKKDGDIPF